MSLINYLFWQIYLDIPNLDYTTETNMYVTKFGQELPESYAWPRVIIHAVADIIKQRHGRRHVKQSEDTRRTALIRKVAKMEDQFVETACKTLI